MAGRTILGAAYGIELHSQDGYMHTVRMAVEGLNLGLSTRALLYDLLPLGSDLSVTSVSNLTFPKLSALAP